VSLNKGKLRHLEFVQKPEPQWNVVPEEGDSYDW
jgi:hypothetical protein